MTAIVLHPSPLDRLDPVALAVRWWTNQMLDIIGAPRRKTITPDDLADARNLPRHVQIALPETDGFIANVRLPKGHAEAHRQALSLKLSELTPAAPADLCLAGHAISRDTDGVTTYAIAMARRSRLTELDLLARKHGARSVTFCVGGDGDIPLLSPEAERARRTRLLIDAGLVVAIATAAVAASLSWSARIRAQTEVLADRERDLRGAAVAAETAREQAKVSLSLVERGILNRRSTTALDHLATLNLATPKSAWRTRVVWTPLEVTIAGLASDPNAAIAGLSEQAKTWSIEVSGEIAASASGAPQAFEVIARSRKAATQ